MEDDTQNTPKAEGYNTESSAQVQPIQTHQGNAQPSLPANDIEEEKELETSSIRTKDALHNRTFQGTHKQQSENTAGIEESKARGLPGSAPGAGRVDLDNGGQRSQFFQPELGAARRNFTTCSDEEGNYSLGPSTEKDLVGNLLTPSNEDLQPVTDGDGDAQNQFNMFTGSDQNQQPIGDQELKLKTAQVKNLESQNDPLPQELATQAAAQIIETGTESGSRQLSLTEQTITYGDTELDQINRMNEQMLNLVS